MALLSIAKICDTINEHVGRVASWLGLAMVLMMALNVLMRYLFAMGDPWQQEIVRFMHAALFLLGTGYALKHEQHVRVDVLYQYFSPKIKAYVNMLGTVFFLFPFAFALIYFSYHYVLGSWNIFEGSSEYLGMPGVFLIKSCIWVSAILLIVQGVSVICRSLLFLQGRELVLPPVLVEDGWEG